MEMSFHSRAGCTFSMMNVSTPPFFRYYSGFEITCHPYEATSQHLANRTTLTFNLDASLLAPRVVQFHFHIEGVRSRSRACG